MKNKNFEEILKNWQNIDPDYKNLVLEAYRHNDNFDIENSDIDHAKFLSFLLINKANKNIRLVTGQLKEAFYGDEKIKKAFEDAIKRKVKIDIVIDTSEPDCKKFIEIMKSKPKVTLAKLKNNIRVKNHFLISDESAFRIESPHNKKEFKDNQVKGMVNFNNPDLAKKIAELFDTEILENTIAI